MNKKIEVSDNELAQQKDFSKKVHGMTQTQEKQPLAYVDTYGCQQNEADSEKLRGMLVEMGYGITYDENEAAIAIVNTCAIRENAENRVLGNVGALIHTKRANPDQLIIFCGCLAGVPETVEKVRNSYHHVRLVFPPNNLWRFPELVYRALTEKKRVFETDCKETVIAEGIPTHRDGTVNAWLSVMYGCNNFCSYCIVPYVRGRERSRKREAILEEAQEIVASGYKTITLLGQNVNSYGDGEHNFASLIRDINKIEGDFLIRFMTSHPKDASTDLFHAMAESEKAARHIHLPFQAGSDRILKLMNRGYTQESYLEKLAYARKLMPDIVITSDVIVGYPGETEEDFEETLKLIEKADFEAMFTFIYSKRPGTPAAKLPDTVTREEKQVRFDRLMTIQNEISEKKHSAYIGKTLRVLVDGVAPGTSENVNHSPGGSRSEAFYDLKARTNGGRLVHLTGDPAFLGNFINAKITHINNWSLFGEVQK